MINNQEYLFIRNFFIYLSVIIYSLFILSRIENKDPMYKCMNQSTSYPITLNAMNSPLFYGTQFKNRKFNRKLKILSSLVRPYRKWKKNSVAN